MKYKRMIDQEILELEQEKLQLSSELSTSLSWFKEQIDNGKVDGKMFNMITQLYNGLNSIEDQLEVLYYIKLKRS